MHAPTTPSTSPELNSPELTFPGDRPVPLSILDLCPIVQGGTAAQALADSLQLAQLGERLGYRRFWLAEHHGMPGIASAATAVVMAHIAAGTSAIRVGAGGVMLLNHSPLVIAEQFGTLESLHPGRIDLGLGRAPGSDPRTARALRRNLDTDADDFPQDVVELMQYLDAPDRQPVRAIPGAGLSIPIWILGSSLFGAQLAAHLGLPYAFASHFAPGQLMDALAIYRAHFKPSARLARPHVMLGVNVIAADTDEQAQLLATSIQQAFVNLRSGRPAPLPPPVAGYADTLDAAQRAVLDGVLAFSAIGSPQTVRERLAALVARTQPDELMVTAQVFDAAARRRSFELLAGVWPPA
jgi:luciferase family oxidoreductase group 1